MKKVKTIWHAIAIVMGMYLVFVVSVIACASTTDKVDMNKIHDDQVVKMEASINYLESVLDSVEAHFPLMDTIGEGDAYFDLCETRKAFNYCRTYEDKCTHYKVYRQQFDDVMDDIMTTLAEYEDSVTFDLVRSMYNNDSWWCKMHE